MRLFANPLIRSCAVTALAYLATTWISLRLLSGALADAPLGLRVLVGLLPIIPIGFAIRAVVRLARTGDELQQRIDVDSLAVAALVTGLGSLTASLLVQAGAFRPSAQDVLAWVFPALSVTYVIARVAAARRYR